jgi:hypothetical protein
MSDWTAQVAALVLQAGPVAKAVLLILLGFSIVSWTIVFDRWRYFRQATVHIRRFQNVFATSGLVNLHQVLQKLKEGPLSRLAQAGMAEFELSFKRRGNPGPAVAPAATAGEEFRRGALLENVERALVTAIEEEVSRSERRLPFLATTAAVGPRLGQHPGGGARDRRGADRHRLRAGGGDSGRGRFQPLPRAGARPRGRAGSLLPGPPERVRARGDGLIVRAGGER